MSEVIGVGIDVAEVGRVAELVERHGKRFFERVFTPRELDYCLGRRRRNEHLAARFAAKEAVAKALGTGIGGRVRWRDIEVVRDEAGPVHIALLGGARDVARKLRITRVLVSLSHTSAYVAAQAVAVGREA